MTLLVVLTCCTAASPRPLSPRLGPSLHVRHTVERDLEALRSKISDYTEVRRLLLTCRRICVYIMRAAICATYVIKYILNTFESEITMTTEGLHPRHLSPLTCVTGNSA